MPSKGKPFNSVSKYVLQNVLAFVPIRDGFFVFRLVNKKFNECLIDFVYNKANYLTSKIDEYTDDQYAEARDYINTS